MEVQTTSLTEPNPAANSAIDPLITPTLVNQTRAELHRYQMMFGETDGARWYAEGLDYVTACEMQIISLQENLESAESRAAAAEQKWDSLSLDSDCFPEASKTKQGQANGWGGLFREKNDPSA